MTLSGKDQSEMDKVIGLIDQTIEKIKREDVILGCYSKISSLYILSLITYPHATSARYPSRVMPLGKYDENLGIVQCFDKISGLLDKVVSSLKLSLAEDKVLDYENCVK